MIPELDAHGIDLMSKMLQYDPAKRVHATEALKHPYFDSLDKSQARSPGEPRRRSEEGGEWRAGRG